MEFQNLILEEKGNIAVLKINRPKALNALNGAVMMELDKAVDYIDATDSIRVVILTGEGEKSFVAGADIGEMFKCDAAQGKEWGKMGVKVFRKIEKSKKIFIAAINGFALGGGCELSMACDIRVASKKAKMGQPEVGLGIIPGYSGTQRLPRLVGLAKAKELIYTCDIINGEEAYRIGLVNYVVEPEELINKAEEIANKILKNSMSAVVRAKESINLGMQMDIDSAIESEANLFGLCFADADQKEGMGAFLEKRKPNFK